MNADQERFTRMLIEAAQQWWQDLGSVANAAVIVLLLAGVGFVAVLLRALLSGRWPDPQNPSASFSEDSQREK